MWLLILLFLSGIANADVYVVTDQNNAVYSLSEQNSAVIPAGYTLTTLKGQTIENLPVTGDSSLYNFSGGTFTLNTTKVQAQQAVQTAAIALQTAQTNATTINQQLRQQREAYIDALIAGNTAAQQVIVATEPALVTQATTAQSAVTAAQSAETSASTNMTSGASHI